MTQTTWIPQAHNIKETETHYIMYSGTSFENAEKIINYGAHEGIYLTTDPDFASNYGEAIVVFQVPKTISVSPKDGYEFPFEAELDSWGTHSIILWQPFVAKVIGFDSADKVVEAHYYTA
jgi:hypothetical protein